MVIFKIFFDLSVFDVPVKLAGGVVLGCQKWHLAGFARVISGLSSPNFVSVTCYRA